MYKNINIYHLLARFCVLIISLDCIASASFSQNLGIKTVQAVRQDLYKEKTYTGQIIPEASVEIKPKSSAWLQENPFYPSQRVQKGEIVAILEHSEIEAQVKHAEGGLIIANANWEKGKLEVEVATRDEKRAANLFAQKHISDQEYDQAKLKLQTAKSAFNTAVGQLEQTKATLTQLQIKLADCFIRSPVNGVVTARHQDIGNYIGAGSPILQIIDDSQLRISINVIEDDLAFLKPQQTATFTVDSLGSNAFTAHVLRISPLVRSSNRCANVELNILEKDRNLFLTGMNVKVQLLVAFSKDALVIPTATLRRDAENDKDYVFVLEQNTVKRKDLNIGMTSGNLIAVLDGINENEQIINENITLYDGMKLRGKTP